jgi:hypothetical protein
MTEDVRFIRGNDRISQLAQRPDLAEGVAQVRRDMEEAESAPPKDALYNKNMHQVTDPVTTTGSASSGPGSRPLPP